VQASPAVWNPLAKRGELQLPLADADEDHRGSIHVALAVDFDFDRKQAKLEQGAQRCHCGCDPISKAGLQVFAGANEMDVRADAARVEEEPAIHDADIGRARRAVRGKL
jgi:hypothetical protein